MSNYCFGLKSIFVRVIIVILVAICIIDLTDGDVCEQLLSNPFCYHLYVLDMCNIADSVGDCQGLCTNCVFVQATSMAGNQSCTSGYYSNNGSCSDQDECVWNRKACAKNQRCHNVIGSYECLSFGLNFNEENMMSRLASCADGYRLVDGVCEDVDECTDGGLGQKDCREKCRERSLLVSTCTNLVGYYKCSCAPYYSRPPGLRYTRRWDVFIVSAIHIFLLLFLAHYLLLFCHYRWLSLHMRLYYAELWLRGFPLSATGPLPPASHLWRRDVLYTLAIVPISWFRKRALQYPLFPFGRHILIQGPRKVEDDDVLYRQLFFQLYAYYNPTDVLRITNLEDLRLNPRHLYRLYAARLATKDSSQIYSQQSQNILLTEEQMEVINNLKASVTIMKDVDSGRHSSMVSGNRSFRLPPIDASQWESKEPSDTSSRIPVRMSRDSVGTDFVSIPQLLQLGEQHPLNMYKPVITRGSLMQDNLTFLSPTQAQAVYYSPASFSSASSRGSANKFMFPPILAPVKTGQLSLLLRPDGDEWSIPSATLDSLSISTDVGDERMSQLGSQIDARTGRQRDWQASRDTLDSDKVPAFEDDRMRQLAPQIDARTGRLEDPSKKSEYETEGTKYGRKKVGRSAFQPGMHHWDKKFYLQPGTTEYGHGMKPISARHRSDHTGPQADSRVPMMIGQTSARPPFHDSRDNVGYSSPDHKS